MCSACFISCSARRSSYSTISIFAKNSQDHVNLLVKVLRERERHTHTHTHTHTHAHTHTHTHTRTHTQKRRLRGSAKFVGVQESKWERERASVRGTETSRRRERFCQSICMGERQKVVSQIVCHYQHILCVFLCVRIYVWTCTSILVSIRSMREPIDCCHFSLSCVNAVEMLC